MVTIGKTNERHAMDVLGDDQIKTIENSIKMIDRHLEITEVNYETGFITIGHWYNEDEPEIKFLKKDFMKVNVNCESVGCICWEVVNAVFKRCM